MHDENVWDPHTLSPTYTHSNLPSWLKFVQRPNLLPLFRDAPPRTFQEEGRKPEREDI